MNAIRRPSGDQAGYCASHSSGVMRRGFVPVPVEDVEPEDLLALPLPREDKAPPIGCPVGRTSIYRPARTGDVGAAAPVQGNDPRTLLAILIVHAKEEPSTVGRDIRLELENPFEVEHLAKGRAVRAREVCSVGAREDDAPACQLVRGTR